MRSSTLALPKGPCEPTVSPQDIASKKPDEKEHRASMKEKEPVKVQVKKKLGNPKPRPQAMKPVRIRRAHLEAVLIKPAEVVFHINNIVFMLDSKLFSPLLYL